MPIAGRFLSHPSLGQSIVLLAVSLPSGETVQSRWCKGRMPISLYPDGDYGPFGRHHTRSRDRAASVMDEVQRCSIHVGVSEIF
jgi:hypothetical protein